jgi:glutathione-regulated potassium-efflux system ancillary protein KefF
VLYAHPHGRRSTANRRLIEAVADLPGVTIHDLYQRYPDYDIDLRAEQAAVQTAALVVFQYPTYWYSLPPLLKLWIDTVLTPGWAHGPGGTALAGKHLWCVTTTGGDRASYAPDGIHGYPYEAFLPPLVQTARLCGMVWLPPWVLHGVPQFDAELPAWAARYRQRLATYPTWVADPD